MKVLEQHMLPSGDISFRDLTVYNGRTHSASVTAVWLCSKRVCARLTLSLNICGDL